MEKDNIPPPPRPSWSNCGFGMEIQQSNELNYGSDPLPNCFFNSNWDNSMDQSDPFESALSSIVSSPAASNAGNPDGLLIRELIGRLGSICNSGDIANNNSTNTSCYSTPLNSPPKLNLSIMDSQIRGNLPIPGIHLPSHPTPTLAPFSADPGFAERAARFSPFCNSGFNETELPYRLMRASSNQSFKVAGSQMGGSPQEGNFVGADSKKFGSRLSRPSTPENNAEFGDSREGSSVSEQIPGGGEVSTKVDSDANVRKRKSIPRGKAKETPSAKDAKVSAENDESYAKRSKQDEDVGNDESEPKDAGAGDEKHNKGGENLKPPEPPKDYIHVRARRGQATDSHSLAERVRREKISERMKFLQDLVPGCNKVTGKAVMLDEIINYVQSLQRQVEFLSMKLATVNPRMDFNMDVVSKDILQSRGALSHTLYPLDSAMPVFPYGYQSQQQVPPPSHSISNGTETQFPVNSLNAALLCRNPPTDGFGEANPQVSTVWENDLQSVVQMGFGQNQQQSFHGSMAAAAPMKIEL